MAVLSRQSSARICKCFCAAFLLLTGASLMGQERAYLVAKVHPGRAGVFIDGVYVGPAANFRSARKYDAAPGKHEIKLVDPRYEEATTSVDLTAGKTTKIEQTLKPLPPAKGPFGEVRVKNFDKYAAVYVNGKYHGHAGEFNNSVQGLLLPAGSYSVAVEPLGGGKKVTQQVEVQPGKTVIVTAQ
jgi:hypothetical protein